MAFEVLATSTEASQTWSLTLLFRGHDYCKFPEQKSVWSASLEFRITRASLCSTLVATKCSVDYYHEVGRLLLFAVCCFALKFCGLGNELLFWVSLIGTCRHFLFRRRQRYRARGEIIKSQIAARRVCYGEWFRCSPVLF